MSGYGRGVADGEGLRISFELRSVNHRFCRVGMNLPAELAFFEGAARQLISERIERGKIDLSATLRGPGGLPAVQINAELAASYQNSLAALADDLGIDAQIDLAMLTSLPGVVSGQTSPHVDADRDAGLVRQALTDALDALDEMRAAEGEHLAEDMTRRFETIAATVADIERTTTDLPARYRDLLSARIEALLEGSTGELDPARLAHEVAYYADRSDITEELVRLRSHIDKAAGMLESGGSVGRSLEFLMQEMHREINTIGAKAKVVEIGELVVELKSELERVREQVQNVE
jgi:uncharacterized protein (TIGR00255 family)